MKRRRALRLCRRKMRERCVDLMKRLLIVLVAALLCLVSCVGGGAERETEKAEERPICQDESFPGSDKAYTLVLTDGEGELVLGVEREGALVTAEVESPAELAGVKLLCDASGMRMLHTYGEVSLSEEAAAGLSVFVDAVEKRLTDEGVSVTPAGAYSFKCDGYDVTVTLTEAGVPGEIEAVRGGYSRRAVVQLPKAEADEEDVGF